MNINNIEDAKNYVVEVTSGRLTFDKSQRRLENLRKQLNISSIEEHKKGIRLEIERIEEWLKSPEFISGDYAQGIDDLILELIEWRALINAFQNADTESKPFREHIFFFQWYVGAIYAIFSILGKLVSKDKRDNSLRTVWKTVYRFIESDGGCLKEEISYINQKLLEKPGHFTNDTSKAFLFRNTVIAHNEKSLKLEWIEVDRDIEILVRIWSLLVSWSSFGIIEPFRKPDQALSGLEKFFNTEEMLVLKAKRQEYLDHVCLWGVTQLHNGARDLGRGFTTNISITLRIAS